MAIPSGIPPFAFVPRGFFLLRADRFAIAGARFSPPGVVDPL